jgi:hypothetical protein
MELGQQWPLFYGWFMPGDICLEKDSVQIQGILSTMP